MTQVPTSMHEKHLDIGCMLIHDTTFLTLQDCMAMSIDTGTALARFIKDRQQRGARFACTQVLNGLGDQVNLASNVDVK